MSSKAFCRRFMVGDLEALGGDSEMAKFGLGTDWAYAEAGPVWTLIVDGSEVAACGGIIEMWTGVGEAWAVLGPSAKKNVVSLFKNAKHLIELERLQMKLHRLQTVVEAANPQAVKFAIALGFRVEGLMTKFGPDETDYLRLARVW